MMASKTGKLDIFEKCLSNTEMFFRSIFSTMILSVSDTIQHSSLSLSCLDPTTWMTDNLHRSSGVSPLTRWTSFQLRVWRGLQLHDRIWRLQILVEPEITLLTLIMQQFVFGECFIE